MRVNLRSLQPNPMRDFTIDPIDAEVVESLTASIHDYGFWGGIACRVLDDGTLEIAAGHHRIEAALAAGVTEADVYVRKDITDAEMVWIYGTENATQRGNTSTALAGTVASALRFCIKELLLGRWPLGPNEEVPPIGGTSQELLQATKALLSEKGVGEHMLEKFLPKIPGVTHRVIYQQLANLKASGDYARMVTEVEQELAEAHQRALAAAEAAEVERQHRLQEEQEAQARRVEADRKAQKATAAAKAARAEEDRRRQERRAQEAEVARQRAFAEAQLAKKQREEADAKRADFESLRRKAATASTNANQAAAKAAARPKTFDFEGVAKHLRNAFQLQAFREVVTSPGIRPYLPVEQQAALAAHLVSLAAKNPKIELSAVFIRENVTTILLGEKEFVRAEDRTTRAELEREDLLQKAENFQEEFCRYAYSMANAGDKLAKLCATWPAKVVFPWQAKFLKSFQNVQAILERLTDRLPPSR
jgi:flagellar biosynthesis GTPase FlhF